MAQQETVVMEVSKGRRSAMLSAPLVTDEHVIGSLLLITPTGPNLVLDADVKTLESLAQFFSVMLELGETEHQIALRKQANSARYNRRSTLISSSMRSTPSQRCA